MLLGILLFFKFIIYTGGIDIVYNRIFTIAVSTIISSIILIFIFTRKSEKKNRNAVIFYSLVSILMAANIMYYRHFNSLPSVLVLKQATQLTAVGDSLKYLFNVRILLLVIDLPILIYSYKMINLNTFDFQKRSKKLAMTLASILVMIIIIMGLTENLPSLKAQELYTYHFFDIKDTIQGKKSTLNIARELSDKDLKDLEERTKLKKGNLTGVGKDKNLIVLQIEALQDFVIGLEYNGQEITPNLNKLIGEKGSIYFTDYHQLLGRGNTSDAEFVSNNSLYPSMEEPTYVQYEKNTYYGLPWLLRDNGYSAWAFHGYEKKFWNREAAYENQGFEKFVSEEDYDFDEVLGFGIRDEDFYPQTIDYIKEMENPFYAFVISLSSHTPFNMPKEYNFLKLKEEHKDNMIGGYLNSIHYADREIGKFIEGLKKEGLYDDTVIAIYGDHFGISANQEETPLMKDIIGRDYDYDDMMHIPLIVHIPGENINKKVDRVGSQLDFYPTIMNIMGYENKKGLVFGRDLLNYRGENLVASQTYMLKGSFIDENSMLEISRDGIYEHSRYIDRTTRKNLDLDDAVKIKEKAIEEIEKSNYILINDYLKEYRK